MISVLLSLLSTRRGLGSTLSSGISTAISVPSLEMDFRFVFTGSSRSPSGQPSLPSLSDTQSFSRLATLINPTGGTQFHQAFRGACFGQFSDPRHGRTD